MANIKENWEKVDKTCPSCGQVTERAKGITKQNMRRLFTFNYKNPQEWIITVIIIGLCFLAWAYQHDMAELREFKSNQNEYCIKFMNAKMTGGIGVEGWKDMDVNLTNLSSWSTIP